MTSQTVSYNDIQEGRPRITTYEDNGVRTTTTTTKLGPDPTENPRETVSVRTFQHPDATETITVTEKKLPPIRYTETITKEKLPKKVQIPRTTPTSGPATEVLRSINIPPTPQQIPSNAKSYNIVRRERIVEEPDTVYYPPVRQDRVIVTQTPRTVIREPAPTTYIPAPSSRTTRIVEVRQPPSPVIVDVATPPLTRTTKKTTIINDNAQDTYIDDQRTLVNYKDDYYSTRRVGRRSDWCGNCGANCFDGCNCFDDCCGTTNCCRMNSFARRKDVVSYGTRVTKDGRRVRYRNADVPGYRCCNCFTGWCSRSCPCCACLEWFCACPCWLWLCCLLPLILGLLGLSIGLLTQLPSITSNTNNANVETLRVIKQQINETWYIYGSDQPCSGGPTGSTIPSNIVTVTTLIPCALTTTSWARIIQATTLITISQTIKSNSNQYNELRVTQTYNTVLAVLGEYAICQPDRNLPGSPLYCDQTTTRFSVSGTASSSTVYAIQVNQSDHLNFDSFFLCILLFSSISIQQYFRLFIRIVI